MICPVCVEYMHFEAEHPICSCTVCTFEGEKSLDFSVLAILVWKMSNLIPLLTF